MYVPRLLEEPDVAVLHGLIRAHPLGMWVTQAGSELVANHIPFLLDAGRGPHGTLVGHVARANPVWEILLLDGRAVPTWNYAVVPASGTPRAIRDRDWMLQLVTRLTDSQASRPEPSALVRRHAAPPEGE